jgi:hypothetical protein
LLEQEQLIKEAYIEEIKDSIDRFRKGIEASIYVAPLLKSYLEVHQREPSYYSYNSPQRTNNFLAGSIFASALFLGSVIMLPHSPNLSYGGFIASIVTFVTTIVWKKNRF